MTKGLAQGKELVWWTQDSQLGVTHPQPLRVTPAHDVQQLWETWGNGEARSSSCSGSPPWHTHQPHGIAKHILVWVLAGCCLFFETHRHGAAGSRHLSLMGMFTRLCTLRACSSIPTGPNPVREPRESWLRVQMALVQKRAKAFTSSPANSSLNVEV